jgi:hypothetical protein
MFSLDGLSNIRKVKWMNLRPGSIVLSGVKINNFIIPELKDFPVLTDNLLNDLLLKYKFLGSREVVIADALYNYSPMELSRELKNDNKKRNNINYLRQEFTNHKKMILHELNLDDYSNIPIIGTDNIERDYLIKDTYNSFSYMYGLNQNLDIIPSLFHRIDLSMSINDLLTKQIESKFNLPEDKEVLLHMVVDLSKSMDSFGKLDLVISAVNNFYSFITNALSNTKISLYVFSDTCKPVNFPLKGTEIKRSDTNYSSFMKKVLHCKDKEVHNKIILFTDGLPGDKLEALKIADLIKKNNIDYTQIIFDIWEEQRHEIILPEGQLDISVIDNCVSEETEDIVRHELKDDELDQKMKGIYKSFTEIAEHCGGNQIILKINELIKIVSVECYDRYLGLLTLATRKETEVINNESFAAVEKNVKKWDFRKLY